MKKKLLNCRDSLRTHLIIFQFIKSKHYVISFCFSQQYKVCVPVTSVDRQDQAFRQWKSLIRGRRTFGSVPAAHKDGGKLLNLPALSTEPVKFLVIDQAYRYQYLLGRQ